VIGREELEAREERELRPYAMKSRLTRGREYPGEEHSYRPCYQRDRDRIVHSTAFRRLQYKTQVFVNNEGDYYRTRLTHTMEVVQIARSMARALGLNEDLTECLALAHDLGHGPFGHSGEDALNDLMSGEGGFEHNTHGYRVVSLLESRYPDFPGLNLTYEVRESMLKHSGVYVPDAFHPAEYPLLEARVADLADRIAYNNHDLDDGLTAGILTPEQVREVPIIDRAFTEVESSHPNISGHVKNHNAIIWLINWAVTDVLVTTVKNIEESGISTIDEVRAAASPLVAFSPEGQERQEELHRFLFSSFYSHYRVARMQEKAKRFLTRLFREYEKNPRSLPPDVQDRGEIESYPRAVCDYIASMTDRRAQGEYLKLFQPFERV
jgi:dGTPase